MEHITTDNVLAERFADTFKMTLKKSNGEETEEVMSQQFLRTYKLTPNLNISSRMSPTTLVLPPKLNHFFDKLILGRKIKC